MENDPRVQIDCGTSYGRKKEKICQGKVYLEKSIDPNIYIGRCKFCGNDVVRRITNEQNTRPGLL